MAAVAAVLAPGLEGAFLSNPGLNGLIVGVFLVGIVMNFRQVLLLSRTAEPLGQRRYWPIYEAAQAANLPIGVHAFGYGGWPVTAGGWASYYIEEMVGHSQAQQALLISMIFEGVPERFPHLRIAFLEAGATWVPYLMDRMDEEF